MAIVIWTEYALEDLKSIYLYISNDSKKYADKLVDRIFERVDNLTIFPQSGRIVPEFGIEDTRELIEGPYRIIYKIQKNCISVIRIHHSARLLK